MIGSKDAGVLEAFERFQFRDGHDERSNRRESDIQYLREKAEIIDASTHRLGFNQNSPTTLFRMINICRAIVPVAVLSPLEFSEGARSWETFTVRVDLADFSTERHFASMPA